MSPTIAGSRFPPSKNSTSLCAAMDWLAKHVSVAGPGDRQTGPGGWESEEIHPIEIVEAAIERILMRKLGSKKCDLWRFFAEMLNPDGSRRYSDREIMNHLWYDNPPVGRRDAKVGAMRVVPPMLQIWSRVLASAFSGPVGTCKCYERYGSDFAKKVGEKYDRMRDACHRNHSVERFSEFLERRLKKWPDVDPEDIARRFLKRAIDGNSNLNWRAEGMFRAFGNSMSCAVIKTPGDSDLYLVCKQIPILGVDGEIIDYKWEEWLSDSRDIEVAQESFELHYAPNSDMLRRTGGDVCHWVCDHCRTVAVGSQESCRRTPSCCWRIAQVVGPEGDNHSPEFLSYCAPHKVTTPGGRTYHRDLPHLWPDRKTKNCPECGRPRAGSRHIAVAVCDLTYNEIENQI